MSGFKIVPAERQGIKPLIGMYGRSGGGKTHSALLLARGIVGDKGNIVLIDTENKRGHIFSDLIPGSYNVLDIAPPFSPERYIEAIQVAEKADIIVTDSLSHEWYGEGGILDMQEAELTRMAGDDWRKREACRMASWIRPKMAHKKMVGQILRLPMPVICCLRGEQKTHSAKDKKGKNTVVTDDFSTPIFDSRFIFEMLINGEIYADENGNGGYLRIGKITHKGLRACLPSQGNQIGIEHGRAIADWCASPGTVPAGLHRGPAESGPIDSETVRTGIAKITKSESVFKIYGAGNAVYTTEKEELATLAKSAHDAGCEIEITHKGGKIENIEMIEG